MEVYLPGFGPKSIRIDYRISNGKKLGEALKVFGTLTDISIGQGGVAEIDTLFSTLGKQERLQKLSIFNVKVDSSFCMHLQRFPNLVSMSIVPSRIDGEQMPLLSNLQYCDLSFAPVTDAGFLRLLKLPALKELTLNAPVLTLDGLKGAIKTGSNASFVVVSATKLPPDEVDELVKAYRKRWPQSYLEVD